MDSTQRWKEGQKHTVEEYEEKNYIQNKGSIEHKLIQCGIKLEDIHHSKILEIGAGHGIIHSIEQCQGFALDPLNMEWSEKFNNSQAHVMAGVGESLPIESNTLDYIFTWNVLDHVLEPTEMIAEAYRTLNSEGKLILQVNTYEIPRIVRRKLLTVLGKNHPHYFSAKEVKSMLIEQGFKINYERIRNRRNLTYFLPSCVKNPRAAGSALFQLRSYHVLASK